MPFVNKRGSKGITDTFPIACPSPKQIVHGLGLCTPLSELHPVSETKGLKLSVLLKQSVWSYLWWIIPVEYPWILQVTCLPSKGWMFHGARKGLQWSIKNICKLEKYKSLQEFMGTEWGTGSCTLEIAPDDFKIYWKIPRVADNL